MFYGNVSLEIVEGFILLCKCIVVVEILLLKFDEMLNVVIWNVCEFGKKVCSEVVIYYIVEIVGQFDFVGLVEVCDNLFDFNWLLLILGLYWDMVYLDIIFDVGGNCECICYLFDSCVVCFNGMVVQVGLLWVKCGIEYVLDDSWWCVFYVVFFRVGNFDFLVFIIYVCWGDSDVV